MKNPKLNQAIHKTKSPKYTPILSLWQFSHKQHGHVLSGHALPTNNAVRAYK